MVISLDAFFRLSGTVDLTPFKHESVRDHRVRLL